MFWKFQNTIAISQISSKPTKLKILLTSGGKWTSLKRLNILLTVVLWFFKKIMNINMFTSKILIFIFAFNLPFSQISPVGFFYFHDGFLLHPCMYITKCSPFLHGKQAWQKWQINLGFLSSTLKITLCRKKMKGI